MKKVVAYIKESYDELVHKVSWPTYSELTNSAVSYTHLYRYGEIAYIGGGFGVGIHNTLEAAVYGIPVIFGPRCV